MVRISDEELLRALKENGRIPYTDLAKRFGVTEAAIRKRVNRLVEKGIIKKFTIEVDRKKLGLNIEALIGLDTEPDKFISILEELKKNPKIEALYSSTGDHMIMMDIFFKTSEELHEFVKYLENLEGVTKVCPAILLDRIK